jgi:hypothetical protein
LHVTFTLNSQQISTICGATPTASIKRVRLSCQAINSMFSWYRDSQICYAYLNDVPQLFRSDLDELQRYGLDPSPDLKGINGAGASAFLRSKWFTRGWTLQELLAPCKVQFYSQEWIYIADRALLAESILRTAHIDCNALTDDPKPPRNYSIAVRMSWASARTTTVLEDEAYCLRVFLISKCLCCMEKVRKLSNGCKKRSLDRGSLTRAFLRGGKRLRILIRRRLFSSPPSHRLQPLLPRVEQLKGLVRRK